MAAEENVEETGAEEQESNGGANGGSNGHNLAKVAALAAASGATAYATKKALSSRSSSSSDEESDEAPRQKKKSSSSSQGSASLAMSAVTSGWDVAKDSLTPIVEDAATKAGTYVAERAPDLVRDVVVPRFIAGFEKAKRGKRSDDESED